jgi:hypothetical protein
MQQLSEMQFRFQEKKAPDQYAQELSDYLKYPTPRELVLSGPKIIFEHATEEVRRLLETLTVESGRVVLMAQNHLDAGDGKGGEVTWEVEPWYGTEYTVRRLEEDFVASVSDCGHFLRLWSVLMDVFTANPCTGKSAERYPGVTPPEAERVHPDESRCREEGGYTGRRQSSY